MKTRVKTFIVRVSDLSDDQKAQMYELMLQSYCGVTYEIFLNDLMEKQHVIMLCDSNHKIVGFSTLIVKKIRDPSCQRKIIAIYSGDTILEKEYWGSGALTTAFGVYILKVKLQNPFTRVYWFLMSKGYKTYLLMANNFSVYYPRHDKETPERYKLLINEFYSAKFAARYRESSGLVYPSNEKFRGELKSGIAPIDQKMLLNKKISFFVKKNPEWAEGVELACVAKVTPSLVKSTLKHAFKKIKQCYIP